MSKLSLWKPSTLYFEPRREFNRLRHEMNELFGGAFPAHWPDGDSLLESAWSPQVDVTDSKDEILVKAELPGMDKADVKISVENNVLTIQGEKKKETGSADKETVRSERYYGSFSRSFTLPAGVEAEKAKASFRNGVLEPSIPKTEAAKPRQINIEAR